MKKGFTFIELLAVIVILAIIALIATPIVLSIIDDSKESSTIRSAEGYLRAVEYEIAQAYVTPNRITEGNFNVLTGGNICIDGYENNECTGSVLEIEYNNEGPLSGTITLEEAKITHYTLTYPSGITVVDGKVGDEIEDVVKVCSLTLDENGNGIADTGDMITCSTESFHVIENDGTTISMFAQYNLDVSEGGSVKQSATTDATVPYGTYNCSEEVFFQRDLSTYTEQYKTIMKGMGVDIQNVSIAETPDYDKEYANFTNFSYTNYWTENETGECAYEEGVDYMTSDGNFDHDCSCDDVEDDEYIVLVGSSGVRPIVQISVGEL